MFTNRFFIVLVIVALAVVGALIVEETIATSVVTSNEQVADAALWQAMGEYYQKQAEVWPLERSQAAEDQPYSMDSATLSYTAWGQAMRARNAIDSGTRSYMAWGEALEKAKLNALDSGTRSYIAWGEALEAAGKLGVLGTCSNMTQENIFAGRDSSLDSATRSYIAWGLALQAKNDIRALCR
jgi:hypothetical protein